MKRITRIITLTALIIPLVTMGQETPDENCFECRGNQALGSKSSAFGLNNVVNTDYSSAFGYNNLLTGTYSSSFGKDNIINGSCSFSLGLGSVVEGANSIVLGSWSKALWDNSFVLGNFSTADGIESFVIGDESIAGSELSVALGHRLNSAAGGSFTLGIGYPGSTLINYISNSFMIGMMSNYPTFFVGPSPGAELTGRIGIGNITNPLAKLHIKADVTENATMRLESTGTGKTAGIEFGSGDKSITTADGEGLSFTSQANKPFRFVNGDIYLEDINQGIIMHSPDGNCWRGTLDNSGMLNFVPVDCEELITNTDEKKQIPEEKVTIYPNPAGDKLFVITTEDLTGSTLEIYDLAGKLKYTTQIYHPETCIELDFCSSGTYILKILNKSGKLFKTTKIIKAE